MKTIDNYIIEKLSLRKDNKNLKTIGETGEPFKGEFDDLILDIDDNDIPRYYADEKYPDDKYSRYKSNKVPKLWWKMWKILVINGQLKKPMLNLAVGNPKPTSYSTCYAELSYLNIIVPNKKTKCLEPQPVSKWKV